MAVPLRTRDIPVEFQPMSPEEMQRTMQFLLAQQAKFAADFEKLTIKTERMTDAIIGLTGIVGRHADQHERTEAVIGRLADQQEYLIDIVTRIADRQNRTDEQIRETNAQLGETNAQLRETITRVDDLGQYIKTVEAHLNAVVEMFERHLREDHGQRPS
jgi:ABC-type transporter Mla subunit MlaD